MRAAENLILRIRVCTGLFMLGLVVSGITAIPLATQLAWADQSLGLEARALAGEPWAVWVHQVGSAIESVAVHFPFLFLGTDWLAFGHFAIALVFWGALRDPVRNEWLFTFGIITCIAVVPYAFVFGEIRGVPVWWRVVDSSFGLIGLVPLVLSRLWLRRLAAQEAAVLREAEPG